MFLKAESPRIPVHAVCVSGGTRMDTDEKGMDTDEKGMNTDCKKCFVKH